jgi:two-component system response regulator PrrA
VTRILVVDDDLSVRSVVGDALRQEGYEVDAVGKGRKALAVFGKHQPDALVLDLEMPVMDGPTLVHTLRERTKWLVVLSGTAGVVDAGLQLCAQAFLSKPFELSELLRSVERVVQPD